MKRFSHFPLILTFCNFLQLLGPSCKFWLSFGGVVLIKGHICCNNVLVRHNFRGPISMNSAVDVHVPCWTVVILVTCTLVPPWGSFPLICTQISMKFPDHIPAPQRMIFLDINDFNDPMTFWTLQPLVDIKLVDSSQTQKWHSNVHSWFSWNSWYRKLGAGRCVNG